MIDSHRLFTLLDRTYIEALCEPFETAEEFHEAVLAGASAMGLEWTHTGWLAYAKGPGGSRMMTSLPVESFGSLEAIFGLETGKEIADFTLIYCLCAAGRVQMYLEVRALPGRGSQGEQYVKVGFEDGFPFAKPRAYELLAAFLHRIGARQALGLNPRSIVDERGAWVLASRRPILGPWPQARSFYWLNLIDDRGMAAWLLARRGELHCHRVEAVGGGRALLVMWPDPFRQLTSDEAAYAENLARAAQTSGEIPRGPQAKRGLFGGVRKR